MNILLLWKYQVIFRINLSGLNGLNGLSLIDSIPGHRIDFGINNAFDISRGFHFQRIRRHSANPNTEKLTIHKTKLSTIMWNK